MSFKCREQIAYVPLHVRDKYHGSKEFALSGAKRGEENADGIEFGFVTSVGYTGTVFCRFWSKGGFRLRTAANSEGCNAEDLVPFMHTEGKIVDALIDAYKIAIVEDDYKPPPIGAIGGGN